MRSRATKLEHSEEFACLHLVSDNNFGMKPDIGPPLRASPPPLTEVRQQGRELVPSFQRCHLILRQVWGFGPNLWHLGSWPRASAHRDLEIAATEERLKARLRKSD